MSDTEEPTQRRGGRFTYNPAMFLPKDGFLRENWETWLENNNSMRIIDRWHHRPAEEQYECFLMSLGPYGRALIKPFIDSSMIQPEEADPIKAIKERITARIMGKVSSMSMEQELITMKQASDEPHHDYIKRLQSKASECTFGIGAECKLGCKQLVRDRMTILRLILGGTNRTAAKHMAMTPDVTLDDAIKMLNSVTATDELLGRNKEDVRAINRDRNWPSTSGYQRPSRPEFP
jgi:hypothetical protein